MFRSSALILWAAHVRVKGLLKSTLGVLEHTMKRSAFWLRMNCKQRFDPDTYWAFSLCLQDVKIEFDFQCLLVCWFLPTNTLFVSTARPKCKRKYCSFPVTSVPFFVPTGLLLFFLSFFLSFFVFFIMVKLRQSFSVFTVLWAVDENQENTGHRAELFLNRWDWQLLILRTIAAPL